MCAGYLATVPISSMDLAGGGSCSVVGLAFLICVCLRGFLISFLIASACLTITSPCNIVWTFLLPARLINVDRSREHGAITALSSPKVVGAARPFIATAVEAMRLRL